VNAGPNTQNFQLSAPTPISGGVQFDDPLASFTTGVPKLFSHSPFGFDVPAQLPSPATPNSVSVLSVAGELGLDPGDGSDGGLALNGSETLAVAYGEDGRPDIAAVQTPDGDMESPPLFDADHAFTTDAPLSGSERLADAARSESSGGPIDRFNKWYDRITKVLDAVPKQGWKPSYQFGKTKKRHQNGYDTTWTTTIPGQYGAKIVVTVVVHKYGVGAAGLQSTTQLYKYQYLVYYNVHLPDGPCMPPAYKVWWKLFANAFQSDLNTVLHAATGKSVELPVPAAVWDAILRGISQAGPGGAAHDLAATDTVGGPATAVTTSGADDPGLSADLIVGGSPVETAAVSPDGTIPLRSGGAGTSLAVAFSGDLTGQAHGAFQYGYATTDTTFTNQPGAPTAASLTATGARAAPIPPRDECEPGRSGLPGIGGGTGYIDPSGTVHTGRGLPVAGARVVLTTAPTSQAPFSIVPNGSPVMSPANRRNPDVTDTLGFFGWDVLPGFYRVTASHPGCVTAETGTLDVPPPVIGLSIALSCQHLHYASSSTSLRAFRELGATANQALLLSAHVTGRTRGRPAGTVTFWLGRREIGQAALNPRSGIATLLVSISKQTGLTAHYSGDGDYAVSHSAPLRRARARQR